MARANRRLAHRAGSGLVSLGIALIGVNILGYVVPLRGEDVDGYLDFAGVETLEYTAARERLELLSRVVDEPEVFVTEATRVFHAGMAHISPADVRGNGLDHYSMRVPVWENWILFALSFLKPDTYRDYEFCDYRRALARGTGRCGQQSLALVSYLTSHGFETGFVALGGHAIATAKVGQSRWYLLDPDYGGVVPFGISEAEQDPASVLPYYWSSAARENRIDKLYAPKNRVKYGGPEARFARACRIEVIAYVLKWIIPSLLILSVPILRQTARRQSTRIE